MAWWVETWRALSDPLIGAGTVQRATTAAMWLRIVLVVVFAAVALGTVLRSEEFREWRAKRRGGKA